MLIKEEKPDYISGTQIAVKVMNIRHYESHRHSQALEFIYCFSGSVTVNVAHETIEITEGELIAVEHENVHNISANKDNIIMTLHLDLTRLQYDWEDIRYLFFSCATSLCKPYQQSALAKIRDILIGAVYIYSSAPKYSTRSYVRLAENLADVFLENFCWFSVEDLDSEENIKFKERLNDIITYIQKNYRKKITISQLALREHINENYLSQFLKRTPFHSFTLMVNYIRCFEAEKLLLNTAMSVQEISDVCGFSSKKYFHRYFKYYWKNTPLQHRKWHENYAKLQPNVDYYEPKSLLPAIKTYLSERHVERIMG